jgi:hypothetical protein
MEAGDDIGHPKAGLAGFFAARWRGNVPLKRLFWRDMVVIGTAINLATTAASLVLLAAGLPLPAALAVHFAALPYNLFLTFAVWRTAERRGGGTAFAYQMGAVFWLIVATLI